jgi:DNA topoisomerase I
MTQLISGNGDDCQTKVYRNKKNKESNKYEYKYIKNNKVLKNVDKFNKIIIPPNYKNVVICEDDKKISGYGYDDKNRKQTIYTTEFREKRQKLKHRNLLKLGGEYHNIIKQIDTDFKQNDDIEKKLIALCLILIRECDFRVSSNRKKAIEYEHFGVTTLKCNHITLKPKNIIDIEFVGKKGVVNRCIFNNKDISEYIKILKKRNCKKKDDFIFQYNNKFVDADDINKYLKQFGNITTKNFRTWNANSHLMNFLLDYKKNNFNNEKELLKKEKFVKTKINEFVDNVADKLHNTRAVCKKEYINPDMLDKIEKDFVKFIEKIDLNEDQHINYLKFLQINYNTV